MNRQMSAIFHRLALHNFDDDWAKPSRCLGGAFAALPTSREYLAWLVSQTGLTVRQTLRQKDPPFDAVGLGDASLTEFQLLDTMIAHPILINRPLVVTPRGVRLCRPSEVVLDILPNPDIGAFFAMVRLWP